MMLHGLFLSRLISRTAPALLLAGASLFAAGARAQATDPQAAAREARQWLLRIHDAAGKRNFQGTFVVSTGASVASARIVHFCDGRNQYERIEPLDGQKRQVYRHNEIVHSFWPQKRLAVVETRRAMSEFPALLTYGVERIVENYTVKPLGEGRVAGHEAHVLLLRPKDAYRYALRLWSEKDSGLLLRAEVLDERDAVLEASAFSEVAIGVKARPELVLQAMQRLEGYQVQHPVLERTDLEREGWAFGALPPGFAPVSTVRRPLDTALAPEAHGASAASSPPGAAGAGGATPTVLQTIYSDGLTYVSVFVEPYDAQRHRREMVMALGATQTLVRRQGDWWLTVIGDVPATTLRAFASGLERRR